VARVASDDDQRVKRVQLTSAGRRLVRRVLRNHPAQIESILAGLDAPERRELQRLLGRLGEHLQTLVDQPAPGPSANGFDRVKTVKAEASVRP